LFFVKSLFFGKKISEIPKYETLQNSKFLATSPFWREAQRGSQWRKAQHGSQWWEAQRGCMPMTRSAIRLPISCQSLWLTFFTPS